MSSLCQGVGTKGKSCSRKVKDDEKFCWQHNKVSGSSIDKTVDKTKKSVGPNTKRKKKDKSEDSNCESSNDEPPKIKKSTVGKGKNIKKVPPKKNKSEKDELLLFIKTLMGSIYEVRIKRNATVYELKEKISEKVPHASIDKQVLRYITYGEVELGDSMYPDGTIGKKLYDNNTLDSYNILSESTIDLFIRLR